MHRTHHLHLIEALFRATDYGVLMTDVAGTDLLCNPRFGELFGMDPHKVGRLPREEMRKIALACVSDPLAFSTLMDRVYADPLLEYEDDIVLKAPRTCTLRRHTAPVRDETGALLGRVWTFLDVSETRRLQAESLLYEKRLEERLDAQAQELQAAQGELLKSAEIRAVGMLAVGVAHDIRNVLTSLRLELSSVDASAFKDSTTGLMDRLYTLTHALLALSEEPPLLSAAVDVVEIADFAISLVRGQAEIDQVQLSKQIVGDVPYVRGSARRLEHLFINLILNGMNAVAERGGIVTVTLSAEAGSVRVDIRDNGPGIADADLPHLFDAFFTTRANRVGLGLFSARRIVEAHSGEILIEGNAGSGACVSVLLPIAQEIDPAPAGILPVESCSGV